MLIAFKLKNSINHMFKYFRSCDGSVFCDMPNEKNRSIAFLLRIAEIQLRIPDL